MKNLQDEINKIPFINTDWGLVIIVLLVFIISSLLNNILGGFWVAVALSLVLIAWKLPTIWKRLATFFNLIKSKLIAMFQKKQ
jgi:hypothetical protein